MSEEFVVSQCSPTMAGLKTGSLFSCPVGAREELVQSLRQLNDRLVPRGARLLLLRVWEGKALLYMYRPARLEQDLSHRLAREILARRSYPLERPERCLGELIRRLRRGGEFPHEIGLFLGYPPEDVLGFITHKAQRCKCAGAWKVYGDEEQARRRFAQYQKCTRVYCQCYQRHCCFDRLVVAVPHNQGKRTG